MCGRFALTAPASTIAEIFQVDVLPDLLPRYNIAPTTEVPAVFREDPVEYGAEGTKAIGMLRWGLVPSWSKDKKGAAGMINARSETVATKPAFRAAFKRRRCLIVADAFYEWERSDPKHKVPHLIGLRKDPESDEPGKVFAMAGLHEYWTDPDTGEPLHTCTIVTVGPNALMTPIHDRMPVILPPDKWELWLDPKTPAAVLTELMVPYPAEEMAARKTSKLVGDVKNKGPEVQGPWEG